MGRFLGGAFCALGSIILATGCADVLCVNTPARVPPYQRAILDHPNQRIYFSEGAINEARKAKQVLGFPSDFDENVSGFFRHYCPYQYTVKIDYIVPVSEKWGSYDATFGCAISAHELTHMLLYFERHGESDGNHEDIPVWANMEKISMEICIRGSSTGWDDHE